MESNVYNKEWESIIHADCENKGYFEIDGNKNMSREGYFCIMMPPPNITGVLHIGHALDFTLQDIVVRHKRMSGFITLWQPGLDHAGIATQNVLERNLAKNGIRKEDLGREKFVESVWKWKRESEQAIINQMKRMGLSPAFKRMRFTMDDGLANAVKETFIDWYEKGYIYRGERMINWCTHDGALSDIEVEYESSSSKLYYIRYPLKDSPDYLTVATTRPETIFGDTAIMVNPGDDRYKRFVGRIAILPMVDREIKVIADECVDPNFGTGVVKVTPAHDMNDYEVGVRHKLDVVVIFDKSGILNEHCSQFEGMDRLEARGVVAYKLQKIGLLEMVEDCSNSVAKCYRCGNVIEPYISKQWFIRSAIANGAIDRVQNGELTFYPSQWKNNYNSWMRELKDWCISRQLWWGHRIPVFYCECGNEFASKEQGQSCPRCGSINSRQDEDVLDTWFSSGLWSHTTLGFKNGDFGRGTLWNDDDLKKFHPNSLVISGFDILFFWIARMLMSADANMKQPAFKNVYLHALVCDQDGNKMSKSRGNVIDPMGVCDEYGLDAVRFCLCMLTTQGRKIRLSNKKLEDARKFVHKIINAANFLKLSASKQGMKAFEIIEELSDFKTKLGRYMKSRFNLMTETLNQNLNEYRFDSYASSLYKFLWTEFCDNGIELAKADKCSINELGSVFLEYMKAIHPVMPFLSEFLFADLQNRDIRSGLGEHESIMVQRFPLSMDRDCDLEKQFDIVLDVVTSIRRIKVDFGINNEVVESASVELDDEVDIIPFMGFITRLAKVGSIKVVSKMPNGEISDVGKLCKVSLAVGSREMSSVRSRIDSRKSKVLKEIDKLESILNRNNFLHSAPQSIVNSSRERLATARKKLQQIQEEEDKIRSM